MEKGQPYFLIWFAEIEEEKAYNGSHNNLTSIPIKYIEALKAGELASPNALSKRIDELNRKKATLDWLLKVLISLLISLLIGICIKIFLWDKSKFEVGFQKGYEQRESEMLFNSKFDELNTENEKILIKQKQLIQEIDSLKILIPQK